jgi:hypothetical protein
MDVIKKNKLLDKKKNCAVKFILNKTSNYQIFLNYSDLSRYIYVLNFHLKYNTRILFKFYIIFSLFLK